MGNDSYVKFIQLSVVRISGKTSGESLTLSGNLTQKDAGSNIPTVFNGVAHRPQTISFLASNLCLVVIIFVVVIVFVTAVLVVVFVEDFPGTGSHPVVVVDLTSDEDPTNEDGDIGMGNSTGVLVSLGGGISLGGKKTQESNIGNSDNTRDGGTIVGGRIVTCGGLMASYACMTFI
ncbi:hypothetical protein Tco_1217533 [Tanacetum coccineum]